LREQRDSVIRQGTLILLEAIAQSVPKVNDVPLGQQSRPIAQRILSLTLGTLLVRPVQLDGSVLQLLLPIHLFVLVHQSQMEPKLIVEALVMQAHTVLEVFKQLVLLESMLLLVNNHARSAKLGKVAPLQQKLHVQQLNILQLDRPLVLQLLVEIGMWLEKPFPAQLTNMQALLEHALPVELLIAVMESHRQHVQEQTLVALAHVM
jgi:hypothetical protein